jgi:hypothetical protein
LWDVLVGEGELGERLAQVPKVRSATTCRSPCWRTRWPAPAGVVTAYKNLRYAGRDFRITKAYDLDLRPIYHYLDDRFRGHVPISMLAAYLTFGTCARRSPSSPSPTSTSHNPATRSPPPSAYRPPGTKTAQSTTATNFPIRKYGDLLDHLSTLDRQTIDFNGHRIEKLTKADTCPAPCLRPPATRRLRAARRAFPLTLSSQ